MHGIRQKRRPTEGDPHDLGRGPVERRHELLENLYIGQDEARVVLKLKCGRKYLIMS